PQRASSVISTPPPRKNFTSTCSLWGLSKRAAIRRSLLVMLALLSFFHLAAAPALAILERSPSDKCCARALPPALALSVLEAAYATSSSASPVAIFAT